MRRSSPYKYASACDGRLATRRSGKSNYLRAPLVRLGEMDRNPRKYPIPSRCISILAPCSHSFPVGVVCVSMNLAGNSLVR